LIDDNAEDCAEMRQMLLRGGNRRYRFSEAAFGAEGVRKLLALEDGRVDCVLLDYALPDMDGLEVLAALRQGAALPPCPVVVITGAAVEEGQALLSAGAQDFIGKRWTSADSLTRAVENAVDRYALQVERRRAEDALRGSEERYRALFNSIDAGYALLEVMFGDSGAAENFRYLQVNPAFARQTGLVNAEGRTILELVPDIEPQWIEVYGAVALTGQPVRLELESGSMQRWFGISAFRLGEASARQVAVLFNDITERKQFEKALMAATAEAERANRAKSDFLLSMSHELRSPLSAMLGFAQLIEGGTPAPTPGQRDSLQEVLRAGWYLLGLINEILDLTAIESGKLVFAAQPVSLNEVLEDCRAMVETQARGAGVELHFPSFERPCLVQADVTRTKQVLLNLLTNAIKYNRKPGRVEVRCTEVPGQRIRVSVEDTGPGLSAVQRAQLFEPFNRLGQETGGEPGTGIGLVISKRLVELMGGAIGVESTLGVGSCFWFELGVSPELLAAGLRVRTVLCIDHGSSPEQSIEERVARWPGVCVLRAGDIVSGIEMARIARPDAILIGVTALDPRAMEAMLQLSNDPATAHIPVIALGAELALHVEESA
jgi:PAS domain S-box-containing protein